MNLLVTGGAGFIGSHFVRAILDDRLPGLEGATVTVLDKVTWGGSAANLGDVAANGRLSVIPADVRDAPMIAGAVRDRDAVVHFAAESGPGAARTNVAGTQVLLDAALRSEVPRFVQVSGAEVYGSVAEDAWAEDAPLAPTTPFAASKAGADLMALAYHRGHDLPVVVTRAALTYGTFQHPARPLPRLVTSLLDGRPAALADRGRRVRDWLHVDDHCRALALVVRAGRAGEVYHIGGSLELSWRDLTGLVLAECGAGWNRIVPDRQAERDDHRRALDDDKIRRELGWRPRVEFTAGLTSTIGWYRNNADWWRPLLPG
jgi:dTDP-glucose 4,6-dehydratase